MTDTAKQPSEKKPASYYWITGGFIAFLCFVIVFGFYTSHQREAEQVETATSTSCEVLAPIAETVEADNVAFILLAEYPETISPDVRKALIRVATVNEDNLNPESNRVPALAAAKNLQEECDSWLEPAEK